MCISFLSASVHILVMPNGSCFITYLQKIMYNIHVMQIKNYLFLDIESSSGSIYKSSICSIGYVLTDINFNVIETNDILVNPKDKFRNIDKHTGKVFFYLAYDEEEFRKSPEFPEAYKKISSLIDDETLVIGYAISGDIAYLNRSCHVYKLNNLQFQFLDIRTVYRLKLGVRDVPSLQKLANSYGIDFLAHRSDEDARATMLLLKRALDEEKKTFSELVDGYGIKFGYNCEKGYLNNFSLKYLKGESNITLSNIDCRNIVNSYVQCIQKSQQDKDNTIFLNIKLFNNNVYKLLPIIKQFHDHGYYFVKDAVNAKIILDIKGTFADLLRDKNQKYLSKKCKNIGDFEIDYNYKVDKKEIEFAIESYYKTKYYR